MKQLVIIKLGGSYITDKAKPFTARRERIMAFAAELAAIWRDTAGTTDFLLGNGAGSFGHFPAHEYGLREGAHDARQRYGMGVTHTSVVRLNTLVAEVLAEQDLPAFALSPAGLFTCADRKVATMDLAPVRALLQNGCMPVLHGDTIVDTARGTTIFSTEQALALCARGLQKQYRRMTFIQIMDVAGVLDEQGTVIARLGREQQVSVYRSHTHDVTGGIISKVENAREAAVWADAVYLIGGEPGALQQTLAGRCPGTQIL